MKLDNIDLEILSLLQQSARTSLSAIAREVHLSITAVTKRIERMEDDNVIRGCRITVDPDKVGLHVHGFIVGGVYRVMLDEFCNYINSVLEIVRCDIIMSGGKEVLLEFYCEDMDHLMNFYKSGIRKYLDSMTVYLVKGMPEKNAPLPLAVRVAKAPKES